MPSLLQYTMLKYTNVVPNHSFVHISYAFHMLIHLPAPRQTLLLQLQSLKVPLPLPFIIPTATIIKVPNITTIEDLFLQPLIDLIMYMASPSRRTTPTCYLGRKLC